MAAPLKTFIIYARADDAAKSQLILQLRPLIKLGTLDVWHDGNILPGEEWDAVIKRELTDSELVLFLVSANSLNSDYIQKEFKTALERFATGHTRIIPIVVAPCGWKYDPILKGLQALPLYKAEGVKPVRSWADPDEAWASVVDHLGEMALELQRQRDIAEQQLQNKSIAEQADRAAKERQRQEQEAQQRRDAATSAQKKQEQERLQREQEAADQRVREAEAHRARQQEAAALAAWQDAENVNTVYVYEAFANNYSNHVNAREARYRAKQLRSGGKPSTYRLKYLTIGVGVIVLLVVVLLIWMRNPIIIDSSDPDMVLVHGGTYTMGCTGEQQDCETNETAHKVTISDFYISRYETTQKRWREIMGDNPSYFKDCDQCPVEDVSWDDVQEFIKKLNQITGKQFRLPTEAEWEYAARGGGKASMFGNGEKTADATQINFNASASYKTAYSITGVYRAKTVPVGSLNSPNALGLHDMSGNVLEWCSDWYGENYDQSSVSMNPTGPDSGVNRVLRGGGWYNSPRYCRVANRGNHALASRSSALGFRLARSF